MNVILLSGGSGKRLWPLSNDIRSKQFIKIFKNQNNEYESMLQRMYKNIKKVNKESVVTIATSETQVPNIQNQIGKDVGISIEPCRRDTFPAIALATAYLHDVKNVSEDEAVVVCPVDPYVEEDYFLALEELYSIAQNGNGNLYLMGMNPTYPSEKYGYIIPENSDKVSKVSMFKEKPNKELAEEYIKQGALWNGGIFAYKIKYVLDIAHKLIDFKDYDDLYKKYETVEKISFDYAVSEKEKNIQVLRFNGKWKDLGTWNTLTESIDDNIIGKGIEDDTCQNTHIVNELNIPILGMGLKDTIIAASPEGILVADKEQSSYMKPLVESINQQIMFAEKSWGTYQILDIQEEGLTTLIKINNNSKMEYNNYDFKEEILTIISGNGLTVTENCEKEISVGDVIHLKIGETCTIVAKTDLKIIDVQIGKK